MQAMTPIKDVFMLRIEAKLDYETLRKICLTGHSRIPVYEEVEIPVPKFVAGMNVAGIDIDDAARPGVLPSIQATGIARDLP